jgi:hypothetical protein
MATWIGYALAFIVAVLWGREVRARWREKSRMEYAENAAATLEGAAHSLAGALTAEREINDDWRLRIIALRETMAYCDPAVAGDLMADALNKLLEDKTGDSTGGGTLN